MSTKNTPAAPPASVAHLLLACFTTTLPPILTTPSNGHSSSPLRAAVISLRDGSSFWSTDQCSVSAKIARLVILLLFCSHLCLLFVTSLPPTFPLSLVRVYARLKRCVLIKTPTTINQQGQKVCLPCVFFSLCVLVFSFTGVFGLFLLDIPYFCHDEVLWTSVWQIRPGGG